MRSRRSFIRLDRGRIRLVLCLLQSGEENGFVSSAEVKATLTVEALRVFVRFIDEQADGFGPFEQATHQVGHETQSVAVCASLFADPDSFQVVNRGRAGDHVRLENQFAVFDDDPGAALFDATRCLFQAACPTMAVRPLPSSAKLFLDVKPEWQVMAVPTCAIGQAGRTIRNVRIGR